MDKANQAQLAEAAGLLRTLIEAPNLDEAVQANLNRIDDAFLAVLQANLEAAQKAKRTDMVNQLNRINDAIGRFMQEAAPPELQFIDELLQLPTDADAEAALKANKAEITQELIDTMNYVGESLRQGGQTALGDRLDKLREAALGELMRANFQR